MGNFYRTISAFLVIMLLFSFSPASAANNFNEADLNSKAAELQVLIDQCNQAGISTDYELVNLTVIKSFIGLIKEDISHGISDSQINYQVNVLNSLYTEAVTKLNGYLSGEKPLDVPYRYTTGDFKTEATRFTSNDGRPVQSVGMGHFNHATRDVPQFYGMGMDNLASGPRVDGVIVRANNERGYAVSMSKIYNELIPALDNAARHNIGVNILLAPHDFPEWLITKYNAGINYGGFIPMDIHDENVKNVLRDYLGAVVPAIKDHPALRSFILTNEPAYVTLLGPDRYNDDFRAYLSDKFGTLANLNATLGTSYTGDFSSVSMPVYNTSQELSQQTLSTGNALFYEWFLFNNKFFADWHNWYAGLVSELAPDVPKSIKLLSYFNDNENGNNLRSARQYIYHGTDAELLEGCQDIMGTDVLGFHEGTWSIASFVNKMKWYDFLRSVSDKPLYDSETHNIGDGSNNYDATQAAFMRSSLWQGAIHGSSAASIWLWQKMYTGTAYQEGFKSSLTNRPDVTAEAGKTNLNLNRLTYEVDNFQHAKGNVAILYSDASRLYSTYCMQIMDYCYRAAIFSGQRVDFITESDKMVQKMHDYDVVIVPGATHVKESTLAELDKYTGRLLVVGQSATTTAFNKNPYNQNNDSSVAARVRAKATVTNVTTLITFSPSVSTLKTTLAGLLADKGLNKVVITGNTGSSLTDVEWQSTWHQGRLLINVYSHRTSNRDIKISIDGQEVTKFKNLITGQDINISGSLTLLPYTPFLLETESYASSFITAVDSGGSVSVTNTFDSPVLAEIVITALDKDGKKVGSVVSKKVFSGNSNENISYSFPKYDKITVTVK